MARGRMLTTTGVSSIANAPGASRSLGTTRARTAPSAPSAPATSRSSRVPAASNASRSSAAPRPSSPSSPSRPSNTSRSSATSRTRRTRPVTPARVLGPRLLFIAATIMLLVFGLVMVYSASFVESFTNPDIQDSSYIFKRQLMLVGIGLVAFVVMLAIDYRSWNSIVSWLPWLLGVVLLILTWATGNEALGGKRWIDVFNFNLQPSEFTKVALLLLSAMLMVRLREEGNTRPLIIMTAVAVGLPALLILLQPDLGTTLIALVGVVAVAWFGELSMKPLAFVVLLIGLVGAGAIFLTDFRTARIDAWLDPWADPLDGGYQIVNALYAFAGGGTTGVGLGMSHQKYLYLSQAHNDLIFPIIGEEFGIVGTITVALLFLLFLFAAFRIARNAPDLYGRVIAGSAAGMIGFQAFLNMLCTVNILPMTGKPLPFFSAGGSSIIVTLMLVGLILNVSLRSKNADEARERRDQLLIIDGGRREMQGGRQPLSWPLGQSPARSLGQFLGQSARTRTAPSPSMASQGARPQAAASRATGSQLRGDTSSKERFRRQPERTQTAQKPLRRVPTRAGQAGAQAGVRSSLPLSSRQAAQAPAVSSQRAASPGAASPRDASQRTATRARVNPALGMSPARNRGFGETRRDATLQLVGQGSPRR